MAEEALMVVAAFSLPTRLSRLTRAGQRLNLVICQQSLWLAYTVATAAPLNTFWEFSYSYFTTPL